MESRLGRPRMEVRHLWVNPLLGTWWTLCWSTQTQMLQMKLLVTPSATSMGSQIQTLPVAARPAHHHHHHRPALAAAITEWGRWRRTSTPDQLSLDIHTGGESCRLSTRHRVHGTLTCSLTTPSNSWDSWGSRWRMTVGPMTVCCWCSYVVTVYHYYYYYYYY